jgi:hypothetical protein
MLAARLPDALAAVAAGATTVAAVAVPPAAPVVVEIRVEWLVAGFDLRAVRR